MGHIESALNSRFDRDKYDRVEEAMMQAGLFEVEIPHRGTKAYDRLVEAAENYMKDVKFGEKSTFIPGGDSENYFSNRKMAKTSFSETERRKHHNQLATILLGKTRGELQKEIADKVSNFAAYVTGNDEYIDSW